jgi:hypothetical protein
MGPFPSQLVYQPSRSNPDTSPWRNPGSLSPKRAAHPTRHNPAGWPPGLHRIGGRDIGVVGSTGLSNHQGKLRRDNVREPNQGPLWKAAPLPSGGTRRGSIAPAIAINRNPNLQRPSHKAKVIGPRIAGAY